VPGSPGADDNASAVAVCLECARLIREHNIGSAMIVFFNQEEDRLLGSSEFVAHLARRPSWHIKEAHIFEMVGYRDQAPGSQTVGITHPNPECSGAGAGCTLGPGNLRA
jgi:Zn-dependent M28 family amino/carboxypeptidase